MSRTTYVLGTVALAAMLSIIVGGVDGAAGFLLGAVSISVWYEVRKEQRTKRHGGGDE